MVKVNSREESSTDTLGMYQTNIVEKECYLI